MKKYLPIILTAFLTACFDPGEQLGEKEYKRVYSECENEYGQTDTSRNKALLIVQAEFAKDDNLSLAPTNPFRAIRMICEVKAQEAKDKANGIVNLSKEKKPSKKSNSKVE
jgi:hypothetical protein